MYHQIHFRNYEITGTEQKHFLMYFYFFHLFHFISISLPVYLCVPYLPDYKRNFLKKLIKNMGEGGLNMLCVCMNLKIKVCKGGG
jgi:hypothetical protein